MTGRLTFTLNPRDMADLDAKIRERVAAFVNDPDLVWCEGPYVSWHVTQTDLLAAEVGPVSSFFEADVEVTFP